MVQGYRIRQFVLFLIILTCVLPEPSRGTSVWPGTALSPDAPKITGYGQVGLINRRNFNGGVDMYTHLFNTPEYSIFRVGYNEKVPGFSWPKLSVTYSGPEPEPGQTNPSRGIGKYWPAEHVPTAPPYDYFNEMYNPLYWVAVYCLRYSSKKPEYPDRETLYARPSVEVLWPGTWKDRATLMWDTGLRPARAVQSLVVSTREGKHWHTTESSGEEYGAVHSERLSRDLFLVFFDLGKLLPYANLVGDLPYDLYVLLKDVASDDPADWYVLRETKEHTTNRASHRMLVWCPLPSQERAQVYLGGQSNFRVPLPVHTTWVERHRRAVDFQLPDSTNVISRKFRSIENGVTYEFQQGIPHAVGAGEPFEWRKATEHGVYTTIACARKEREALKLPSHAVYWELQAYWARHAHGDDWYPGMNPYYLPWMHPSMGDPIQ